MKQIFVFLIFMGLFTLNAFGQDIRNQVVKIYSDKGHGSGFAISETTIITNAHVVRTDNLKIKTLENFILPVLDIKISKSLDIAILTVPENNILTPVTVGNSKDVMVGDNAYTLTNPKGVDGLLSKGIIGGTYYNDNTKYFMIDSVISFGSSGGILFNNEYELIGIITKMSDFGVGLAIPINFAKQTWQELTETGKNTIVNYGVNVSLVRLRSDETKIEKPYGVVILDLTQNSEFKDIGLKKDDVITKINDNKITSTIQFLAILDRFFNDDEFKITYIRDNIMKNVDVILVENELQIVTSN